MCLLRKCGMCSINHVFNLIKRAYLIEQLIGFSNKSVVCSEFIYFVPFFKKKKKITFFFYFPFLETFSCTHSPLILRVIVHHVMDRVIEDKKTTDLVLFSQMNNDDGCDDNRRLYGDIKTNKINKTKVHYDVFQEAVLSNKQILY